MQSHTENSKKLVFVIFPPFYNMLLLFGIWGLIVFILSLDSLFLEIFATIVLGIWSIEFLLLYIFPLRVEIDKEKETMQFRDFQFAPELMVKDDTKDEYATIKPLKKFSISKISSVSYTRQMPELKTTFMSLFPRRTIGCKYSLFFADGERIDIYVGLLDEARHRKAFKKITDYLQIPLEEVK